ncbi:MAG TPA: hypothetical protein VMW63_09325 [Methanoregulaceae archaeon]|nr:hypothetical protein [Methanoregulaceae archaeon]
MDEATRERFKWKFYRLAVLLNAIILCIAIGIIVLFIAPEGYALPLAAALFIIAGLIAIYFSGQYKVTKAWLDEDKSHDDET